jgi:hypothetical protein
MNCENVLSVADENLIGKIIFKFFSDEDFRYRLSSFLANEIKELDRKQDEEALSHIEKLADQDKIKLTELASGYGMTLKEYVISLNDPH